MKYEQKFYDALQNIFVGAPIEGEGGYVNLLKIKERYYSTVISAFKQEVEQDDIITSTFKEDFYDMLFSFFDKYFSECGSVYFAKTANWQRIYERVYSNDKDVALFWKTHMLYYVKSDILFQSIYVKAADEDGQNYVFYFDVGELQNKQNNEKKELVFEYVGSKIECVKDFHDESSGDKTFCFSVKYSERGRKTNIQSAATHSGISGNVIEKAIKVFKKQTSVDFFINKNAGRFLEEQLELFLHQYLLNDESIFSQERLLQIKAVQKYAKKLISFIAQFEDELVRIWNKPKFVRKSNYVISFKTLKSLISDSEYEYFKSLYFTTIMANDDCKSDIEYIIRETYKRPLANVYINEFTYGDNVIEFDYLLFFKSDKKAKAADYAKKKGVPLRQYTLRDKGEEITGYIFDYVNTTYKTSLSIDDLFMDTQYISDADKLRLLSDIGNDHNIDKALDGILVRSDNYHFLTSAKKFENKISMIYIDPPFNTQTDGFAYIDGLKDTTWLTQMYDRFVLLYNRMLKSDGSIFVHGDHHCNFYMRLLLDNICETENFEREIVWNTSPAISGLKAGPKVQNFIRQHDTILYYTKGKPVFNKLYRPYNNFDDRKKDIGWLDFYCDENKNPYIYKYDETGELQKILFDKINVMTLGDVWNDVYSMMYTQNMTRENWGISNTQKPENLLRRFIQSSTDPGDLVLDVFVGSGTTAAAAHKLGRKWIAVDSGDFVKSIVLKRMKSVVMGDFMPKLSEDINWQGGGFFKYYDLEQYEDTLSKAKYFSDKGELYSDNVFEQYVFFADEKLADVLSSVDDEVLLDFTKLYDDIDFPETISLLFGKAIKRIDENFVELADNKEPIKYNVAAMNKEEKIAFFIMLKPLLWWGE